MNLKEERAARGLGDLTQRLVWGVSKRYDEMAQTRSNNKSKQMEEEIKGRGWHGDPEGHANAGRKGGTKVSQDRQHMADIGRRGGAKVSQDRDHMAQIGKKGGERVSQDRSHMAQIGKKGGESR
jgi:general stress protein YciG